MALISVKSESRIKAIEEPDLGAPAASSPRITQNGYDVYRTLTNSSGVPATEPIYLSLVLSGGAATIDLTSLTGLDGTVDGTGLKVQEFRVTNGVTTAGAVAPGSNSAVTITDGATNGYNIFGDASGQHTLLPGDTLHHIHADTLDDIGSSDKTIDFSGTGTDAFEVTIVLG